MVRLWNYSGVSIADGQDGGTALVMSETGLAYAEPSRRKMGKTQAAILGVLLLLFVVILERGQMAQFVDTVLQAARHLGPLAPLVIGALTACMNLLIFPTFPMMVGAGAVFTELYGEYWGAAVGTLTVFLGLWSSSVGAFCLGRFCFRDFAQKQLERRDFLRTINGMVEKEGLKIVFLASMSPILPAGVLNYVCSLVDNLSVRKYAVGCLGLILPVSFWVTTTAHATAVSRGGSNTSHGGLALALVNVVIIALLTVVLHKAYRRHRNAENDLTEFLETELCATLQGEQVGPLML